MTKFKFVVNVQPYRETSGGIYFLHKVANDLGARIIFRGEKYVAQDDEIVIYPEVISGNPLRAKNVVRFLLNKDGLLSGCKINPVKNEFRITFSKLYDSNAFLLHLPFYDETLWKIEEKWKNLEERKLSLVYKGKAKEFYTPTDIRAPLVMVTQDWPERGMLVEMMKQARVLYTSDCWSTITYEALLCGCAPVITSYYEGWTLEEMLQGETPEVAELNFEDNFSEENILRKRESLLKRMSIYKEEYPSRIKELKEALLNHFSKTVVEAEPCPA